MAIILCRCGCGQEVKKNNRFVHGHHTKIQSWNKGLTKKTDSRIKGGIPKGQRPWNYGLHDEEYLKHFGGVFPLKNRKRPDISLNMLGNKNWDHPNVIKNQFQVGQHVSPNTEFKKGNVPYTKGKKQEEWVTTKEKLQKIVSARFKKDMLPINNIKPNKAELKINKFIKLLELPLEYVGDGKTWIGRSNPDFKHKLKKICYEFFVPYFKIKTYGSIESYIKQKTEHYNRCNWQVYFSDYKSINTLEKFQQFIGEKI